MIHSQPQRRSTTPIGIMATAFLERDDGDFTIEEGDTNGMHVHTMMRIADEPMHQHNSRHRGKRGLDRPLTFLSTLSTIGGESSLQGKRLRTFRKRLGFLVVSISAFSLSTSMMWIAQTPLSHSPQRKIQNQILRGNSKSSFIRTSEVLSADAKFEISPYRRLERKVDDTGVVLDKPDSPHKKSKQKVLSFHRIAQHGSTTKRDYLSPMDDTWEFDRNEVDLDPETGRRTRFPSVDERVRVYMSNWYLPPCPASTGLCTDGKVSDAFVEFNFQAGNANDTEYMIFREARTAKEKKNGPIRTFVVDDSTDFDFLRHLNPERMRQCKHTSYCTDFVKYLFPALRRTANDALNSTNDQAPVASDNVFLYQFSDAEKTRAYNVRLSKFSPYPNVPILKKFRFALSRQELRRVLTPSETGKQCAIAPRPLPLTIEQQQRMNEGETKVSLASQPIIMKLKIQRHYGYVQAIPGKDREWSEKKNQAIFRGQFTGRFPVGMKSDMVKQLSAIEQCDLLHRCRLVYNSSFNSTLVDAKLALPILDVRKDFPREINGVSLYGDRVTIDDMLSYKAIIMLEGNDVSSGLKWALYSNSVVLTQTPTKTSWAMEELLEPWVHYVPLADDLSDVEEKMQWVIDNDEEAQRIALRGKLWIHDLVFHPDAEVDEQLIFDEILRRYKAHFVHNPLMELPSGKIEVG
jgi:Glycosyl transferase family 90